jgi:hypothetical protein
MNFPTRAHGTRAFRGRVRAPTLSLPAAIRKTGHPLIQRPVGDKNRCLQLGQMYPYNRRRPSLALPTASGCGLFDRFPADWRGSALDSRAGPRDGTAAGALPTPADLAISDLADSRGPGDAEPHVVVLVRGRVVVAIGRGEVVGVVVPRTAPQPARRTKSLCCPVPMVRSWREHLAPQAPSLGMARVRHP